MSQIAISPVRPFSSLAQEILTGGSACDRLFYNAEKLPRAQVREAATFIVPLFDDAPTSAQDPEKGLNSLQQLSKIALEFGLYLPKSKLEQTLVPQLVERLSAPDCELLPYNKTRFSEIANLTIKALSQVCGQVSKELAHEALKGAVSCVNNFGLDHKNYIHLAEIASCIPYHSESQEVFEGFFEVAQEVLHQLKEMFSGSSCSNPGALADSAHWLTRSTARVLAINGDLVQGYDQALNQISTDIAWIKNMSDKPKGDFELNLNLKSLVQGVLCSLSLMAALISKSETVEKQEQCQDCLAKLADPRSVKPESDQQMRTGIMISSGLVSVEPNLVAAAFDDRCSAIAQVFLKCEESGGANRG
jgi:hypothetical protein